MLVPISEKIKPWLLVSATWGHHSWTFGTVDVAWNPGEQKLPSWIFSKRSSYHNAITRMAEKGSKYSKYKSLTSRSFPEFSLKMQEKTRSTHLAGCSWKTVGKAPTGPPTNTWRLAFQSCTIANTNWRSSAFCVDVVALYQKQGPVFSLNSKSILGYKF